MRDGKHKPAHRRNFRQDFETLCGPRSFTCVPNSFIHIPAPPCSYPWCMTTCPLVADGAALPNAAAARAAAACGSSAVCRSASDVSPRPSKPAGSGAPPAPLRARGGEMCSCSRVGSSATGMALAGSVGPRGDHPSPAVAAILPRVCSLPKAEAAGCGRRKAV